MENKYELPEENNEIHKVSEPAIPYYTTTSPNPLSVSMPEGKLSITERKVELIRSILNEMDDETFENLEMFFHAMKNSNDAPPCQYSVEELRERVLTATRHIEEGKFYTDEELDDFVLG